MNKILKQNKETVRLLADHIRRSGDLHTYLEPDTVLSMLNKGFQNWNCLVMNLLAWLEGRGSTAVRQSQ